MLGVVFVHGFNSSPDMWDGFANRITKDRELAGAGVLRFGYPTGLRQRGGLRVLPSLDTVADGLKEYLRTRAEKCDQLVLVGHSMGGLVIQRYLARMLAERHGRQLARVRRVVMLATPNAGSLLALGARKVLLGSNVQDQALRPLNDQVADTVRKVLQNVVNADVLSDGTCPIPFSVYAGTEDGIVPPASALGAFPDGAALPGDHFTIAREDSTYATLKRLLLAAADGDLPETVAALGPAALEVHNAVEPGRDPGVIAGGLTAYVPRGHDRVLRTVLAAVFAGGPSRLAVLTGESSTGKTRALYEALLALAPDRPLLRPVGAEDLLTLLEDGRLRPGCLLWCNEAQRFLYGAHGERAAAKLRGVLEHTAGIAVVGTLWSEPYWRELTEAGRPGDPHAQARALLSHPGLAARIRVPVHLTDRDLEAWRIQAASGADPRLRHALNAGGSNGRVIQHLSGGPELLAAYLAGPDAGFTSQEHALLTAALDARRLGHLTALPADLLAQAADGALDASDRANDRNWARSVLEGLSSGQHPDGTRTDIRNTLSALIAVRPRAGQAARYEPTDYLDQHTRRLRADELGAPSLWNALVRHTADADDQDRLARAAWARGLRTTAVRLWRRAVQAGHPTTRLVELGETLDPDREAAAFSAVHADLTDPGAVAYLLRSLRKVE
ncbi:alpha/beta fold hydrolase, partial [Kitasatospora nipponensis]